MSEQNEIECGDYPIWKPALRKLRARPDYGYGLKLPASYFERELCRKRDDPQFAFDMLSMRQAIESEDGYYLRCRTEMDDETAARSETWQIPSAAEHEDVARTFEHKVITYAARCVDIRVKTLNNPTASMTDEQRRAMEASSEHAAIRSVLIRRQKSVVNHLKETKKSLLE